MRCLLNFFIAWMGPKFWTYGMDDGLTGEVSSWCYDSLSCGYFSLMINYLITHLLDQWSSCPRQRSCQARPVYKLLIGSVYHCIHMGLTTLAEELRCGRINRNYRTFAHGYQLKHLKRENQGALLKT
ncbi:hypothetical protein AAFF_G00195380 [Aldrovandia affinis]|uniref:Uncharacterized protein n=1 Tax=Aldrovandia affinis TaxID=143900 RepID=A0AAD7SXK7_9TELE|nr:hypothetical protein AAFF_G00195380 [Aldrovandia affinis]